MTDSNDSDYPDDYKQDLTRLWRIDRYVHRIIGQITKMTEFVSNPQNNCKISETYEDIIFKHISKIIELYDNYRDILDNKLKFKELLVEFVIERDLETRREYFPQIEEIVVQIGDSYEVIWELYTRLPNLISGLDRYYVTHIQFPELDRKT